MVFRGAPKLKDIFVRAKLPRIQTEGVRGCFKCGKVRRQVCSFMSEGSSFKCNVSEREYDINSNFTCDSLGVVYLLACKVCGKVALLHYLERGLTITSHLVGSFQVGYQ